MVDMWLAHQLFARLKPGTKVLIVRDADQLESVGPGSVFRELIQCRLVPVTVLDQIFRQGTDSLIAYNAKFIKEGEGRLHYGRDFSLTETESQEETAALIRMTYRAALRTTAMEQVQILMPFRATGDASANSLNATIQAEINPPDITKPELSNGGRLFRLGDRVMQTKNDYDVTLYDEDGGQVAAGVFNGEVGIVSGVQPGRLTVCFDGRYADYPMESLGELELAYATTVHKSQTPGGAFVGMGMDTTRADLTQAVLEGVAFAIRDSFEVAKALGIPIHRSKICGGGAKSPLWKTIMANVLNIQLDVPESEQGPGMGGAMLAMVACGRYPSVAAACEALVCTAETISPDPELAARYEVRYQQFKAVYPALKGVFAAMNGVQP